MKRLLACAYGESFANGTAVLITIDDRQMERLRAATKATLEMKKLFSDLYETAFMADGLMDTATVKDGELDKLGKEERHLAMSEALELDDGEQFETSDTPQSHVRAYMDADYSKEDVAMLRLELFEDNGSEEELSTGTISIDLKEEGRA